jgi:hypothetical protein
MEVRVLICALVMFNCFAAVSLTALVWSSATRFEPSMKSMTSIPVPTSEKPMIVFVLPEFNLGDLNEAANVYAQKSQGGRLKHMKAVIESSQDYQLIESSTDDSSSEGALDVIRNEIEPHVPDSFVDTYPDVDGALIYAYVKSLTDLDSAVPDAIKELNGRPYIGVVTGENVVNHRISKRAAAIGAPPSPASNGPETAWSQGGCVGYLASTTFTLTDGSGSLTTFMPSAPPSVASANCKNYMGSITLKYSDFKTPTVAAGKTTMNITSMELELKFDVTVSGAYWFVGGPSSGQTHSAVQSELNVTADLVLAGKEARLDGAPAASSTRMLAAKGFSFACKEPGEFRTAAFGVGPDPSKGSYHLGIRFNKLQLQPHSISNATIPTPSDFLQPDDCVGFFSPGIWMGIFSMFTLLLIVAFGIGMISNLKTMDRFDDPRQKPLIINVRE